MIHTARLLFVASVCALAVLYGGYAFALPHSHDYKTGKGGWSEGWYGNDDWNDDQWGDKKKSPKYKNDAWGEHEPKKDWFTWGYGKEHEKWAGGKDWGGGQYWGKDPDCDPPTTQRPEPGTLLLLGSSLAAAGVAWRGRRGARQLSLEPSE